MDISPFEESVTFTSLMIVQGCQISGIRAALPLWVFSTGSGSEKCTVI